VLLGVFSGMAMPLVYVAGFAEYVREAGGGREEPPAPPPPHPTWSATTIETAATWAARILLLPKR
jgi:hypothetical protein